MKTYMKENLLNNKTVGGEIALEIHIKETEGVPIMQSSLQSSMLDNVIQHFVMISLSVLCVFRSLSSMRPLRTAA